jgi:hypothetical protein
MMEAGRERNGKRLKWRESGRNKERNVVRVNAQAGMK